MTTWVRQLRPLSVTDHGLTIPDAWRRVERREVELNVKLEVPRRHSWSDISRAVVMLNDYLEARQNGLTR